MIAAMDGDAGAPPPVVAVEGDSGPRGTKRTLGGGGGGGSDQPMCPYLDTVNRAVLDFDFEKCCSVSLSTLNVYACLVCGKFFQVWEVEMCIW